ncbi:hypothetical protein FKW77_010595 [Venturia effusa]|uniref:Uncharacterized protein n=1 Tax=Venturia effusa TaxID=50376 RepID=A0A517KXX9_9PEZI|nr:hypothetical protein FKW77_010595 [Venturia effusa]
MAAANGIQPCSPVKHLFLTLKVDFNKLRNWAPRSKLVTLKLNPKNLATFVDKPEDEPIADSEEEKEEPPLEDFNTPLIRFRHKSDLTQPHHKLLSAQNTIHYRPRISNPQLFEKYLDRHPHAYNHFKGLYFYIDYPANATELEVAVTNWTELFLRIGREAGWMDHVEVAWGRHWASGDANPISLEAVVLEALATVEVERFVRVLGAYERVFVEGVLEDTMTVGSDAWVGFVWG